MAIELRHCESVDVPALLVQLGNWHRDARAPFQDDAARSSLLELTRDGSLGSIWLVADKGRTIGYAVIETFAARGFLWQEADLTALYLEPESRGNGIGRDTRRVLRELLMGRGIAMIPTAVLEDRCWARLGLSSEGSTFFEAA